ENVGGYDGEGKGYKYEVKEEGVDGYEREVDGYEIRNRKVGERKVEGRKRWKEDKGKDGGEMIKVDVVEKGKV
uniref:Cna B-type domain-containing protein n=1 Tax=Bacillus mycoides TaxID=1405 RepID=UPI0011AA0865